MGGELKVAMKALGFEPKPGEIEKLIHSVDDDGDGEMDYDDFERMMEQKILNKDQKDDLLKAFRLFDDDETGKISLKNLKRVAKELGETMTEEELQEMIDEADRDGDGEVNEEEFLRIMRRRISSRHAAKWLSFGYEAHRGYLKIFSILHCTIPVLCRWVVSDRLRRNLFNQVSLIAIEGLCGTRIVCEAGCAAGWKAGRMASWSLGCAAGCGAS